MFIRQSQMMSPIQDKKDDEFNNRKNEKCVTVIKGNCGEFEFYEHKVMKQNC